MKLNYIPLFAILLIGVVFISGCASKESPTKTSIKTPPSETPQTTPPESSTPTQKSEITAPQPPETPTPTFIYQGVTTHSWSNLVTPGGNQAENINAEVNAYEAATGRTVAWVAFGHEWHTDGPKFPTAVATSIKNRGATPLIFLNLRTIDIGQTDPVYNLAAITSGQFDSELEAWADGAKNFGSEIIVDWGWEMNGDFTPWNGAHNGGNTKGPRSFREAYRHIIELMRNRGATNIRWAFHINFPESPDEPWNAFENYYPGDDVVDIIGASIYSAQFPTDDFFPSFESLFDSAYSRLVKMAPKKPVYVFEFGAAANNPFGDSATWADKALADILSGRWPAVRSFAWWNDYWSQDDNPAHDTEMRVEKLPGLATVFKSRLSENNIGDRPPVFSSTAQPLPGYSTLPLGTSFKEYFDGGSVNEDLFEIKDGWQLWTSWLDASKASVRDGSLRLETDAKDTRNGLLKVGGVFSHVFYSYGKFTVRARTNPAAGTIGAIYLYNEDKDRRNGGRHEEIDVELSSKFSDKASIVTFHNDNWVNDELQNEMHRGGIKNIRAIAGLEQFDSREFNTYIIDWQPDKVTWYINGIKAEEFTDAIPTSPMQIHLDIYNTHEWGAFIDVEPAGIGALEIDYITYVPFVTTTLSQSSIGALKTLAEQRGIRFGANYQFDLRSDIYDQVFEREMSTMTAGTFMVDGGISHKSRTEFDFSEMDEKVEWGRAHNMEVHGHILVWYDDIADWVKASPLADVESIMNERIDAFMKRYAGKIKVWDVVNEAVNDGWFELDDGPAGTLRMKNKWAEAMGTDYIRKAFVRAHAADPTAILRYNDYNIESNQAKFEGVKNLLIDLKKQGAPVHALGWQMHVKPSSFDAATLLARMNEIADLGFDNYITELDVELPADASEADYEQQKQTYKTIVKTFLAARRHKSIVLWGLRDGDPYWLTENHPLLFNENLEKKQAYFGVEEALSVS